MMIDNNSEINIVPLEGTELQEINPVNLPDPLEITEKIEEIAGKICDSVTSWKQMDLQMRQMDYQFNSFMAKVDYELTRYTSRIPVVEKQLDFVNGQIEKILDHALAMGTESEMELDLKLRLLESSEKYLDKLSNMIMKLL